LLRYDPLISMKKRLQKKKEKQVYRY